MTALRRACGPPLAVLLLVGALACARPSERPLTVLLVNDILSLDPNQEAESVTDSVLFNVHEPLVGLDEDLKFRMVLAESYEHPSPERWRFRLRKGVRFHDGTPLSAETVREALLGVRQGPRQEASLFLSQIRDIVVTGPDTVDLVTREPRAILASLPFLYISRKGADGTFVGTGPYRVSQWARGKKIVLERFDEYWGGRARFRNVQFVPVATADDRLARLQRGEADIAYGLTPEQATRPTPGVSFVRRAGLSVFFLSLNVRDKPGNPYRDLRVRKALHLALDRQALLDTALEGTGAVATQPIAPLVFGFNPELPVPARDLAAARRLLAEAGHAQGFRTRLDFGLGRVRFAELLRDQLAEVGVTVELNPLPVEALYERAEGGQSEIVLAGWDCSTGVASEFFEYCLHTPRQGYGIGNYGGYSNPVIDEIAETNAAILDQRKRQAVLQRAAAVAMADLPVLPLFVEDDIYGTRPGLFFKPRADSEVRLFDVHEVDR